MFSHHLSFLNSCVLYISRELDQQPDQLLPVFFKGRIEQVLNTVFGEIGGHITVDVLKFNVKTRRAILRVPDDHYVKLRSALTLVATFQDIPCCYKVHSASPVLLSLL